MSLFCLLWMPLFYLFWSSISPENNTGAGGIVALILGSITAVVLFFMGAFIEPGGFGLSRWISGFVDIVSLPVLIPLAVYLLLLPFRFSTDFANFALLWLIPDLVIRTVSWSAQNNPILLILIPLLRTAILVGISFFIRMILSGKMLAFFPAILGILALPSLAASSYWAFFSQQRSLGFLLFSITIIPMVIFILILLYRIHHQP